MTAADRAGHVGATPVARDVQRVLDEVLGALDAAQVRIGSGG